MKQKNYLTPVRLSDEFKYKFGPLEFLPKPYSSTDQPWNRLNLPISELLSRLGGEEFAAKALHDISMTRLPSTKTDYIPSELAYSPSSGGRKFYIVLDEADLQHTQARKKIGKIIKHYLPTYPVDINGEPILPQNLLIAVKGTGSGNVNPEHVDFTNSRKIDGYGGKDVIDAYSTMLINGIFEVDGEQVNLIPNRFIFATVPLDSIAIQFPNTTPFQLDLTVRNNDYPLATGKNQLNASIILELFGPDLRDASFVLNQLSHADKVEYIRENLKAHPFFSDLCLRTDLEPQEWLSQYLNRAMLHIYYFARVATRYWKSGDNRTDQNTGLCCLPRDMDDLILLEKPLVDGSPEYIANFTVHFIRQLEILTAYSRSLGVDFFHQTNWSSEILDLIPYDLTNIALLDHVLMLCEIDDMKVNQEIFSRVWNKMSKMARADLEQVTISFEAADPVLTIRRKVELINKFMMASVNALRLNAFPFIKDQIETLKYADSEQDQIQKIIALIIEVRLGLSNQGYSEALSEIMDHIFSSAFSDDQSLKLKILIKMLDEPKLTLDSVWIDFVIDRMIREFSANTALVEVYKKVIEIMGRYFKSNDGSTAAVQELFKPMVSMRVKYLLKKSSLELLKLRYFTLSWCLITLDTIWDNFTASEGTEIFDGIEYELTSILESKLPDAEFIAKIMGLIPKESAQLVLIDSWLNTLKFFTNKEEKYAVLAELWAITENFQDEETRNSYKAKLLQLREN